MPSDMIPAPSDSVRVTDDDAQYAVRQNQFNCMIVRAIQRKYPEAKFVRVNTASIAYSIGEQRFVYPTQEHTIETMIKPYDRGELPKSGLVRLRDGIVKPVEHRTERHREARERWQNIQRRNNPGNQAHKSDYGRATSLDGSEASNA